MATPTMKMISNGIKDICREIIQEHPDVSSNEALNIVHVKYPMFVHDEVFNNLFHPCFGIVLCQIRLNEQSKDEHST